MEDRADSASPFSAGSNLLTLPFFAKKVSLMALPSYHVGKSIVITTIFILLHIHYLLCSAALTIKCGGSYQLKNAGFKVRSLPPFSAALPPVGARNASLLPDGGIFVLSAHSVVKEHGFDPKGAIQAQNGFSFLFFLALYRSDSLCYNSDNSSSTLRLSLLTL